MLHKVGGGKLVKPGDRVALVFRPDEPAQFATAFYGCIFAAVIPVAIEPPITKEVSVIWNQYSMQVCRTPKGCTGQGSLQKDYYAFVL